MGHASIGAGAVAVAVGVTGGGCNVAATSRSLTHTGRVGRDETHALQRSCG
ncbi:hypothetical protein PF001_g7860 [Phytophthora fragariae]|uniref:Uncharacterized protein n=1 Tax=Phytophthora fragariae TaxID=53985 RepID=A0A6A3L7P8_9STRA|nr:hypothetical protein PF011_g7546 [Phytophthora fragariae]KAE9315289.1 hypothetical protein PF001_g7860 [Phytophthora fragariae]KAE9360754.1 hypothetical protein PF008_g1693 [Phytophthora fragariae]